MTKLGYLIYFVVFPIVLILVRVLIFNKEINTELFIWALISSIFSIIILYFIQRFKKK